jgi:pimeloyl-ACP methyl ester carboxylesterase
VRRGLVCLLLLAVLAASAASAASAATPVYRDGCGTKAERTRLVVFRAPSGPKLVGMLLGSGTKGVVLTHELRANLCRWLPFARVLAKSGYRVLLYDARDHGSSGLSSRGSGGVDRDVVAAGRFLLAHGARKLVVMGASMGATASLVAAPELAPRLAGVVSLSAPAQFGGMDALAAAPTVTVPTLLAVAADDAPFADDARALYESIGSPDKQLEVVPGMSHGTALVPHLRAKLLAFAAKH